jgi:hypothetical protein
MFNFLNSALLVAAAAAVLPFLLHLFSRRKLKVVPFSSVKYLKAMQKRQVRAIKIKQILLLIVRTLIILAVVLAFARPATQGGYLGSHASVSAVVLIDNSASMGRMTKDGLLYDLSLKKARQILDQMGQEDEVAVIPVCGQFRDEPPANMFGSPATAAEFLSGIPLTDQRGNLSQAFNRAVDGLAGRLNLNKELYVISDFQENAFTPDDELTHEGIKTYLVELPREEADNSTVVSVDLGNQLIEVGTEFTVTPTIKRRSGSGDEEILVSAFIDNQRVAQRGLALNSGETQTVPVQVTLTSPGFHSGRVELSDDDLTVDNTFYFSLYLPDDFNVLVVGDNALDTRLVELALAPDEKLRRHWSVQRISYGSLERARLTDYDAVFLINVGSLSSADLARLKSYVEGGGGLFLDIAGRADSVHYNDQLADLTGISLLERMPATFSRAGFYLLRDFDLSHQIFSIFEGRKAGDFSFKAYARPKTAVREESNAEVLARYSDGSPALAVREVGRGRVLFLGCDLSPDVTEFSTHPFFVPFLARSAEYLAADFSSYAEDIRVGQSVTRQLKSGFNARNKLTLVAPDSSQTLVEGNFRNDQFLVDLGALRESGIYHILSGIQEADRFAVNVDPIEGDLYREDWDRLESRFDGELLPDNVALAGFIEQKRFGRELWQSLLWCCSLSRCILPAIRAGRNPPEPDRYAAGFPFPYRKEIRRSSCP